MGMMKDVATGEMLADTGDESSDEMYSRWVIVTLPDAAPFLAATVDSTDDPDVVLISTGHRRPLMAVHTWDYEPLPEDFIDPADREELYAAL